MFEELIKDLKELKVEMNELKKFKRNIFLHTLKELKRFVKSCMYCDSYEYEKKDCSNYNEGLKKRVVFFKKCSVRLTSMGQPLELNFERINIKKLIKDFLGRTSGLLIKKLSLILFK